MSATTPAADARLRLLTAIGCEAVAVGYVLTGSGLVAVTADQPPGLVPPLLVGAVIFGALAFLTLRIRTRWTAVVGAAFQVLFIAGYIAIAPERTPSFEVWGVLIKAVQAALLVAFVWLAAHPISRFGPRQRTQHA